jgi:predicted small secreted protein
MKNKIILVLLIVSSLFVLASCNKSEDVLECGKGQTLIDNSCIDEVDDDVVVDEIIAE